jgi:hypothetical protein
MLLKNVSTMKAAALKDFSPYVAKSTVCWRCKQSFKRLKTMQQLKTIENNLITSIFKVIINFK